MVKNNKPVRVVAANYQRLKVLSKSNRLGLSLTKLANLCIDRGLPTIIKEVGK